MKVDDADSAVADAARALARHGLVTAFGHVSARSGETVTITPPVRLSTVEPDGLVRIGLGATELPAGAPPEAWAHLAVYRRRPDVTAIARAMPPSAFAAGAVVDELRPLHGQAAWLGPVVRVHPGTRLLRDAGLADSAAVTLGDAQALVLRGNGALAVATTPGDAVARMWLVEALCATWLRAAAAGAPRPLADDDVAAWQVAGAGLLPRLWEYLRDGEPTVTRTAR